MFKSSLGEPRNMAGEILRIGACSMAAVPGSTEENIEKIKGWTKKAVDEGVELLLFPELSLSGYWCSNELYFESQPRDGPAIKELVAYLGKLDTDMAISVGLAEKYGGCIYNTQVLLDKLGERHAGEVTGNHEGHSRRIEQLAVAGDDRVAGEATHRGLDAGQRAAIGRSRVVDRLGEDALSAATWIGPRLEQVVHALVAQPIDFFSWERRLEDHLGE